MEMHNGYTFDMMENTVQVMDNVGTLVKELMVGHSEQFQSAMVHNPSHT